VIPSDESGLVLLLTVDWSSVGMHGSGTFTLTKGEALSARALKPHSDE
jgi:hypothetical protein